MNRPWDHGALGTDVAHSHEHFPLSTAQFALEESTAAVWADQVFLTVEFEDVFADCESYRGTA